MSREHDVVEAVRLGVDAVGFVLWRKSPRAVEPTHLPSLISQLPETVMPVGVFVSPSQKEVDRAVDAGVRVVQIHGTLDASLHSPVPIWVARSLESGASDVATHVTLVLDAHDPVRHGGTGVTVNWERAAPIAAERRVVLAGGLTPGNVAGAVRQVRPYGVDVASGIEDRPGIKNPQAMKAFVQAVRKADQ